MRLDFNVLWVDDQPRAITAQIARIKEDMQQHGFEFKPKLCHSIDELRTSLGDGVFNDEVDLVLVDWDLGNQIEGQSAIAEIRDHIRYKDVVFYSGNKSADELRKLAYESGQEGIYCVSRPELVDEVLGVFESLVKKVLDLDHVRGIVMGATSDIDGMVLEALGHLHRQSDAERQAALLRDVIELIEKRLEENTQRVKTLRESNTFDGVLAAHLIFTAYDRARILSRLLQHEAFKAHEPHRATVVAYMTALPKRNKYGHVVMIPEGQVREGEHEDAQVMTLEETRVLRRQLLDLRGDLRNLLVALRGPAGTA